MTGDETLMDDECACGHVQDEHERGVEFCLVELDDGTHCPCVAFDGGVE